MSQQLEEQQDFGSQAVQGHEQKQERKGDTDAKERRRNTSTGTAGTSTRDLESRCSSRALESLYEVVSSSSSSPIKKIVTAQVSSRLPDSSMRDEKCTSKQWCPPGRAMPSPRPPQAT
eukprot:jgi/Bigna1/79098/fgenesh1_pg.59_\